MSQPLVGVVMGSSSDWEVMKYATSTLVMYEVLFEVRVVSAHRTPDLLYSYGRQARGRGLEVLIAGAGGAAHLPGMLASLTTLPVLGVPLVNPPLNGTDSLLSIVQMPAGTPVGTLGVGKAGATNAALLAVQILAGSRPHLHRRLEEDRQVLAREIEQTPGLDQE